MGSNYLGIEIPQTEVSPFLNQLKEILGDQYEEFTKNQQNSEQGQFNLTVINTIDYNKLSKEIGLDKFINSLDPVMKFEVTDLKLMGLGKAEHSGNKSYFIVVKSEQLDEVRNHFGLEPKDFHITLGFKHKDVHGVRKNEVMKPHNKFIDLLKKKYLKEGESFEFVKGIKNFDGDFYKLIEPIKINDTNAILRIGMDYFQISLIDDEIAISAKWQEDDEKPILSDTVVHKKLNIQ